REQASWPSPSAGFGWAPAAGGAIAAPGQPSPWAPSSRPSPGTRAIGPSRSALGSAASSRPAPAPRPRVAATTAPLAAAGVPRGRARGVSSRARGVVRFAGGIGDLLGNFKDDPEWHGAIGVVEGEGQQGRQPRAVGPFIQPELLGFVPVAPGRRRDAGEQGQPVTPFLVR